MKFLLWYMLVCCCLIDNAIELGRWLLVSKLGKSLWSAVVGNKAWDLADVFMDTESSRSSRL